MAGTSQHDKHMEDFMRAEVFVLCIKDGKLKSINDAANGINNAACKKPVEACSWERVENRYKGQYAKPSHSNVEN